MKSDEKKIVPINVSIYDKSNFLISAKYKSTLLENKILAISLAYAQHFKTGENDIPYSEIKVSELKTLLGATNNGSFYQQLRAAAEAMTAKKIGMSSEDAQTFDYLAIVIRATCKDGVFTIEYNPHMKQYLTEIRRNYSRLNLNTMLSFKNNYAFRLYEVLKSKAYYPKGYIIPEGQEPVFHINLSIAELRLELGVVNAELDAVQRVLKKQKSPDYERAIEVSPEKMFDTWYDFKRYVLDPAVRGINETEGSDLKVSYETIKSGKGGRVKNIDFEVSLVQQKPAELSANDKDDFVDRMMEKYELPIKIREMRLICEDSGYDESRIDNAVKCLKSAGNVNNIVGYLRRAIKDNYSIPQGKIEEYKNYSQRDYDWDMLEERLTAK